MYSTVRDSVINHCDRHITLLSDLDISFVLFSCAVGLDLQFVGGPSYFLLMSDIIVRINGHNIVGYLLYGMVTTYQKEQG
jgi:hypothetical protein